MNFIEPFFLVGLLGAMLPLIVHLINRKKAVKVPFGPMKFLLQSNKRKARGFKARQWILMAIRMLIVGLIASALAKPFFLSDRGVTQAERLPTATAIVIDNSFSMRSGKTWDRAQSALSDELDGLRPWDEVVVIPTYSADSDPTYRLTDAHSNEIEFAESISPSEASTDVTNAIELAAKVLSASELPNRRIAVISDFSVGGFPQHKVPDAPIQDPVDEIHVGEAEHSNVAVVALSYEQEGDARDRLWRIDATLMNYGDQPVERQLDLVIAGESVSGASVKVPPQTSVEHTFRHKIDAVGYKNAEVRIVENDDLEFDNTRHLAILLRERINVLVVNGEPNSVVYRDEAFFIERALNPMGDSESAIVVEVTTREGFESANVDRFDVVILANVAKISPVSGKKLETFVEKGGGVMIAMGDQVDVDAYNANLVNILPKPLRGLKRLAERDDPDAPIKITRFGDADSDHPVFRVFSLPGGASLRSVEVYSYMLLEPSPPEQSETVLSFKDNAPALLSRKVGKGRVMLLTTTVDEEWTDFPLRTAFLPTIRRVVQHLARRATSADSGEAFVGVPYEVEVASLVNERAIIRGPDEFRAVLEPVDGSISFVPSKAGVYEIWADSESEPNNRLTALTFVVNADPAESNLAGVDSAVLSQWIEGGDDSAKTGKVAERRVNLWPTLLFIVTLFLLFETILSTRRSVLQKLIRRPFSD